jgi:ATP-dependent Clp protease ATP-binding subunit ClpC
VDIDFSKRSKDAILHARNEALRFRSLDIAPEHLFLGIVKTDDQTRNILIDLGTDVNELINIVSMDLQGQQNNNLDKDIALSKSTDKIMKLVSLEANILKQDLIEPYHLLLSILREPSNLIHREFEKRGLTEVFKNEIGLRVESGLLKSKKGFLGKWF